MVGVFHTQSPCTGGSWDTAVETQSSAERNEIAILMEDFPFFGQRNQHSG
jgi:hypothetical protein